MSKEHDFPLEKVYLVLADNFRVDVKREKTIKQ